MTCRFYQSLYRMLPWVPWQAFIVRIHLKKCAACSQEFEPDHEIQSLVIKPEQLYGKIDLWGHIRTTLQFHSRRTKEFLRRSWFSFAALLSILFVLIVLLLFFAYYLKQSG